ncbi:MAG: DUF2085 domain-containing protein [Candidatus Thermoplasmatota archaeon]|nr:DUF2085 domain-containing protein [Candidatus Thermoplasmatota archaeon]
MGKPNRIALTIFIILGLWALLLFITPYTIPPKTVRGLDGNANMIDYSDLWSTLPPITSQVYHFGDFNCHQKESRSILLNENQMAVCSRDVGVFLGMALGAFLMLRVESSPDMFENGIRSLPGFMYRRLAKRPKIGGLVIFAIAITPLLIDGFVQLLTSYESNNFSRVGTGIFAGWGVGIALCAMFMGIMHPGYVGIMPKPIKEEGGQPSPPEKPAEEKG